MARGPHHRSKARTGRSTLDPRARQAIAYFVRVLARTGCAPEEIAREVEKAAGRIPKSWRGQPKAEIQPMDAAAHVLTLWFRDPGYVGTDGRPLALPLRGPAPSLEALARGAAPDLDTEEILGHLLGWPGMHRSGAKYLPGDRVLMFRGSGSPDHARSLKTVSAMLSTIEHNTRPRSTVPGWFEAFALNRNVPVRELEPFDSWFRGEGNRLLARADSRLHSLERARRDDERTVPLGIGIYWFEEDPTPSKRPPATRARRRPRK